MCPTTSQLKLRHRKKSLGCGGELGVRLSQAEERGEVDGKAGDPWLPGLYSEEMHTLGV